MTPIPPLDSDPPLPFNFHIYSHALSNYTYSTALLKPLPTLTVLLSPIPFKLVPIYTLAFTSMSTFAFVSSCLTTTTTTTTTTMMMTMTTMTSCLYQVIPASRNQQSTNQSINQSINQSSNFISTIHLKSTSREETVHTYIHTYIQTYIDWLKTQSDQPSFPFPFPFRSVLLLSTSLFLFTLSCLSNFLIMALHGSALLCSALLHFTLRGHR